MKTSALMPLLAVSSSLAQGNFQNLDFESATVMQTDPSGPVTVASALPGWTVYYGTNQQTTVRYNDSAFGSTTVVLLGTNGLASQSLRSLEGEFSVLLQGGVSGS